MGHTGKQIKVGSLFFFLCMFFLLNPPGISAWVSTDGTMGPATHLSGPDYQISHDIGLLSGKNLFHSFEEFSIAQGESATFTGPADIANVISRVTGGEVSSIDGLLRSEVGTADFYFINPAGVMFGPNAQVDVPAAFHVSTADELRFENGETFSAVNPGSSSLSLSTPESFGFLSPQPAPVYLNGSYLIFQPGTNVSVSAGSISMTGTDSSMALLMSEEGTIRMTAVGDSGAEVPVNEESLTGPNGNIDMDGAALVTWGNGGGEINLNAGDITLNSSRIHCDNTGGLDATAGISIYAENLDVIGSAISSDVEGQGDSAQIRINAKETISILNGGNIRSNVFYGTGNAGGIELSAKQLVIDGGGQKWTAIDSYFDIITGISSEVYYDTPGNSGPIDIQVSGDVSIQNYGGISSSTLGDGNAGSVIIEADAMLMNGSSTISSKVGLGSWGYGGVIQVEIKEMLEMTEGANISTGTQGYSIDDTDGIGDAGTILVHAGDLRMEGGDFWSSYIASDTMYALGSAKNVDVVVDGTLELYNGAYISSSSKWAQGNAGCVSVRASNLRMDGMNNMLTRIFADTLGELGGTDLKSNAGQVDVTVENTLEIYNKAAISSTANTAGNSGGVNISATKLKIDGLDSKISSSSYFSGFVGDISIMADHVSILNGGSVSISHYGTLTPEGMEAFQKGKLSIDTHSLLLKDGSDISASSSHNSPASDIFLTISDSMVVEGTTLFSILENIEIQKTSRISTKANTGDGGNITIDSPTTLLRDGQITTSSMTGSGGDISLASDVLVLDTGFIQANAEEGALGGDIFINADAVVASGDNLLVGGKEPQSFEPGSGRNIIQAAAPGGEQGSIEVTAPELDIAASLVRAEADFSRPSDLATDPCSASGGQGINSLVLEGRGGMPLLAEDLLDIPWNTTRFERLLKSADQEYGREDQR